MRTRITIVSTLLVALLVPAAIALAAPKAAPLGAQLAEVRRATAQYHDVAAAEAAGYAQASECVPHMGYHYMRGGPLPPEALDATAPNLLVYAPLPNGDLRLVAVEYMATGDTELFGTAFDPPAPPGSGGPPFPTLHAWVWQANPDGMFTAHNPNIAC